MKENNFKDQLKNALLAKGFWAKCFDPYGNAGTCDVLAFGNYHLFGIELKTAESLEELKKLAQESPLQLKEKMKLVSQGATHILASKKSNGIVVWEITSLTNTITGASKDLNYFVAQIIQIAQEE